MKAYGKLAFVNNMILNTQNKYWTIHQSLDSEGTSRLAENFDEATTNGDSSEKFLQACNSITGDIRVKLYKVIPDGKQGGNKQYIQHYLRLPEDSGINNINSTAPTNIMNGFGIKDMMEMLTSNNALQMELMQLKLKHEYEARQPTQDRELALEKIKLQKEMLGMVKQGIFMAMDPNQNFTQRPVHGTADIKDKNVMSENEFEKRKAILKESIRLLSKDNPDIYLQMEKLAKLKVADPMSFNNMINMLMNYPV